MAVPFVTVHRAALQRVRFQTWKDTTKKTDISEFLKNPFEAKTYEQVMIDLWDEYLIETNQSTPDK